MTAELSTKPIGPVTVVGFALAVALACYAAVNFAFSFVAWQQDTPQSSEALVAARMTTLWVFACLPVVAGSLICLARAAQRTTTTRAVRFAGYALLVVGNALAVFNVLTWGGPGW